MLKRILAIALVLVLGSPNANGQDLSFLNRTISWEDSSGLQQSPLIYSSGNPCNGGWSTTCDPATDNLQIINFLPLCETPEGSDSRLDCLESVYVEQNGTQIKGERVQNLVGIWSKYGFSAKPEYGIAKSSSFQIYKFPGLTHDKGDLFMMYPFSSKTISNGNVRDIEYTFLIAPTYQERTQYLCEYLETPGGLCWLTGSFDTDTRFTVNAKMAKAPMGWFTGRITDPKVQITTAADKRTQVAFTGTSQGIPSINRNFHYVNESERSEWNQVSKNLPSMSWDILTKDGKQYSMGVYHKSDAIYQFQDIVSRVPSFDNADSLKNIWRLESKVTPQNLDKSNCIDSSFTGIVSSNSMTYQNSIPSWNASNNSLTYSVASPHTVTGKDFVGRYDLLISEQAGKCFWNVQSLSAAAEISVTSATGESKTFTAASSITEGYYKFIAAGFSFSTNKISVKLVPKLTNPIDETKPKASSNKARFTTITCAKGKTQKIVTSLKPKCPAGYKKK